MKKKEYIEVIKPLISDALTAAFQEGQAYQRLMNAQHDAMVAHQTTHAVLDNLMSLLDKPSKKDLN